MEEQKAFHAQCFAKGPCRPLFTDAKDCPRLRYACHIRSEISSRYPRILHAHADLAELVLIYSGSGRYMIQNRFYPVEKGDLLIYNAGVVHDEMPVPGSDLAFYTLGISSLKLPGRKENMFSSSDDKCRFPAGDCFRDLLPLFELIFRNLSEDAAGAEQFCGGLLEAILSKVLTLMEIQETKPAQADSEPPGTLSECVIRYINRNYMNPITMQDIADALNASAYYIAHVFKEETGYSPIQYLLRRRIGEAQTLLINTDIPIADIAGLTGYETQSYFTTQFKKYAGMPPKQFREKYRKHP